MEASVKGSPSSCLDNRKGSSVLFHNILVFSDACFIYIGQVSIISLSQQLEQEELTTNTSGSSPDITVADNFDYREQQPPTSISG